MATVLSEKIEPTDNTGFVIGSQVLEILTSGMYDNPLMIYREYIQNSVDSFDQAVGEGLISNEDVNVKININGLKRSVVIQDNGVGVRNSDVERVLLSVGLSSKEGTSQRGFRGIGRLGGLAYCRKLIFETWSSEDEMVAVVEWDHDSLEEVLSYDSSLTLNEAITLLSNISYRKPEDGEPDHFFKVRMEKVERFHTDVLMDIQAVSKYLSQVAPVPYDKEKFSFSDEIEAAFTDIPGYKTYSISINNIPVFRPYEDSFLISKERMDSISKIEFFLISDGSGGLIGKGWFGVCSFMSSLPPSSNSRGIRVRQGNIEVGNEYFLADHYSERRFATWQIGEIQIYGDLLKTNARRDGFEHTGNYQTFLERAGLLGRHLSKLCRDASKNRAASNRANSVLSEIDKVCSVDGVFLNEEHFKDALSASNRMLDEIEKQIGTDASDSKLAGEVENYRKKVNAMDRLPTFLSDMINGQMLNGKNNKRIIEDFVLSVASSYDKSLSSNDLIKNILAKYLKKQQGQEVDLIPLGLNGKDN